MEDVVRGMRGAFVSGLLMTAAFLAATTGSAVAEVYLLRGLAGFSHGMDGIAAQLARRGIRASVHDHGAWMSVADAIAAQHRSGRRGAVILVGHSLGADAAMLIAERLSGVPVRLIITFDATTSRQAPPNVQRVANYYLSNGGFGAVMGRGSAFRGALANVDMKTDPNITHTNIDQRLQNKAVAQIQAAGGR
jgi:pimeloyl-ACP methyl ester carboxylesterase